MASKAFVVLTMAFEQAGRNRWMGRCLELGTATHGRTLPQVRDELVEMTLLHLNALEDAGERERFFHEQGIKLYPEGEAGPVNVRLPRVESADSFVQIKDFPVTLLGSHRVLDPAYA
jgi:hypothetical protein